MSRDGSKAEAQGQHASRMPNAIPARLSMRPIISYPAVLGAGWSVEYLHEPKPLAHARGSDPSRDHKGPAACRGAAINAVVGAERGTLRPYQRSGGARGAGRAGGCAERGHPRNTHRLLQSTG